MPRQQKAVLVTDIGKPVILGQRDIPVPSNNEVLIKVLSTMLLPHDAYGRDWGLFIADNLPYVLGSNVAGIIEEVGDTVGDFVPGDCIFGFSNPAAKAPDSQGLQEYATLPADAIAKVPKGVSIDHATTLPVNLATSFIALFDAAQGFNFPLPWAAKSKQADVASSSIVIIGAGAATGKFAVQLAKLSGLEHIIAIAGPTNEDELKQMGATHVVSRFGSTDEIAQQVHAITGENGAINVYDCRSSTFELATAIVPKENHSRLFTLLPIEQPNIIRGERPLCVAQFVEGSNDNLGQHKAAFWKHVPEWLRSGAILPAPSRAVAGLDKVDEINEALDRYSAGIGGPQLIVHPGE